MGSHSILDTYAEYELPHTATRPRDVDSTDDNTTAVELASLVFGAGGELAPF